LTIGSEGPKLKLESFYFFILWIELHGSLYRAILNAKSSLTFGNEGLELKFRSKSETSSNIRVFF
jgi:hypothetical protein